MTTIILYHTRIFQTQCNLIFNHARPSSCYPQGKLCPKRNVCNDWKNRNSQTSEYCFKKHAVTLKCVVWCGALDWKHSLSPKSRSHHHPNISLGFPNRPGAWGSGRMGNQPQKWLQVFKLWNKCKDMGVSENSGFSPQIIHFNRVFHYKPSIFGVPPIFGNTHNMFFF